jgi:hypothetical protein
MFTIILVALLALGLSVFTYLGVERLGRRAWIPLLCRAVAWTALGLLVADLSCSVRSARPRPLVLLDASLSLSVPGGHWREARDSALRWGEVREFGDERAGSDTLPVRGRSLLGPSLLAASASDRPVIVVSDGEVEDVREIPPDILARTGVRLFPRDPQPDWAITRVTGPRRVTAGDSISLDMLIQPPGGEKTDTVTVQVLAGSTRLARRTISLRGANAGRARISFPSRALRPGDHVLQVSLPPNRDREPRTDTRLHIVTVTPTPGVVLLAGSADWDSRFLYRTIREVGQLPVRGFVRLEGNRWRSMSDLHPVPMDQVRRATRQADLLVLKGGLSDMAAGSRARGIWNWLSGESGPAQPGDWYLVPRDNSPVSGAFLGQPVDSFAPALDLTATEPSPSTWVALSAQLGRRGIQRPAVFGVQDGGVRRVTVAVDGLWRWAFRGGASEQTYRSWVAATTSWLLGGVDSAQGRARPVQAVVANGRPVIFEWVGAGQPSPLPITWSDSTGAASDTLYFDGEGRALLWRPPGSYRYRLAPGGEGLVAVEQYSDELLPRTMTLSPHEPRVGRPGSRSAARDWPGLFALCVLAFSAEWLARRRLGLR